MDARRGSASTNRRFGAAVAASTPNHDFGARARTLATSRRFTIYLAGPINGCNEGQKHNWRRMVRKKYAGDFDFIDPSTDDMASAGASPRDLVEADVKNIERSDGILANMWRESIGTTLGIVHASRKDRPVVVADPNGLRHRMLEFYADATADNPLRAAKRLREILRAETSWHVLKSGGRREPFTRRKIRLSVQQLCRQANADDLGVPVVVLSQVMEILAKGDRRIENTIATTDIGDAVLRVLKRMERKRDPDFLGLSNQWRQHSQDRRVAHPRRPQPPAPGRIRVRIISRKAHSTIWGKAIRRIEDIPSPAARRVLDTVQSAPDVAEITFGPFSNKMSKVSCCASVAESDTPFVIEGRLFDRGEKGTLQTFQVRVRDADAKAQVMHHIANALKRGGLWTGHDDI